jgi:hypothetical protein
MAVPKAPSNLDGSLVPGKNNVGFTGQFFDVESKSEPQLVKSLPDE